MQIKISCSSCLYVASQKRLGKLEAKLHRVVNSAFGDQLDALQVQLFFIHIIQCLSWWEYSISDKCKNTGQYFAVGLPKPTTDNAPVDKVETLDPNISFKDPESLVSRV